MKHIWDTEISLGMNILDVIKDEQDLKKAQQNFDRAKNGECVFTEEEYGDSKLFRTLWKNQYAPVKSEDKIVGISVLVEDMTSKVKHQSYVEHMELFYKAVNLVSNGIVISDATKEDLPVVYVNRYFTELTGYELEDIKGKSVNTLQRDDTEQEAVAIMRESIKEQKTCEVELRNYKKDGTLFYNRVSLSPIFNEKNELILYVGIQKDITADVEKKQLLQKVFDFQQNILWISDGKKPYLINQAFKNFYEIESLDEYLHKYKECICSTFEKDERFFSLEKVQSGEMWLDSISRLDEQERKVLTTSPSGKKHIFDIKVTPFESSKYLISMTDISNSMFEKYYLKDKVNYDTLTGAFTREFFNQNILSIIESCETKEMKLGISILDIDDFKKINDTYGHDIGDLVLKNIVNIIKSNIRENDFLVRWGGEEFLLLIPVKNIDTLKSSIENIRLRIKNSIVKNNIKVTASFGITLFDTLTIEESIKKVDVALYYAKNAGKNQVVAV
jgi:diguanylate cyclase (GGDEF)-like protein/PAS domain S-box-containing protein